MFVTVELVTSQALGLSVALIEPTLVYEAATLRKQNYKKKAMTNYWTENIKTQKSSKFSHLKNDENLQKHHSALQVMTTMILRCFAKVTTQCRWCMLIVVRAAGPQRSIPMNVCGVIGGPKTPSEDLFPPPPPAHTW